MFIFIFICVIGYSASLTEKLDSAQTHHLLSLQCNQRNVSLLFSRFPLYSNILYNQVYL